MGTISTLTSTSLCKEIAGNMSRAIRLQTHRYEDNFMTFFCMNFQKVFDTSEKIGYRTGLGQYFA